MLLQSGILEPHQPRAMPVPSRPPRPHRSGLALGACLAVVALAACDSRGSTPPGPPNAAELHTRARAALTEHERAGGDPAAVEAAYAELLRVAPRTPDASLELGLFFVARGDGGRAEPLLRHAVNLAPGDGAALRALGMLLHTKGDLGEAAATLQRAIDSGAADHTTLRALAETLTLMGGEPARAAAAHLRAAEAALDSGDRTAQVHDLLQAARAFRAAGDRDGARSALTQVLARDPRHPPAHPPAVS
jgi:tetratricopeptide (TPR) repeat protein